MRRAQASLVSLAVALLLVTAALGVALGVAAGGFAAATRGPDPADRGVAAAVAGRLVAADGPLAVRRNVLDRDRVDALTGRRLVRAVPALRGRPVRVAVDGTTVAARGAPADGATVRRLVVVEERDRATTTLPVAGNRSTALPAPTARATIYLDSTDRRVTTVRANGRVVRHNATGLSRAVTVRLPRGRQSTLSVATATPGPSDPVRVAYYPWETAPATLAVTVDA